MKKDDARKLYYLFCSLSLLLLGLVWGALSLKFQMFPGNLIDRAGTGISAWSDFVFNYNMGRADDKQQMLFKVGYYHRPRYREEGVTKHNPDKAFAGYTLYTSAHQQGAMLLDMSGKVVHEWKKSFREVWPEAKHLGSTPVVDPVFIMWRYAHLFPNGDILVVFEGIGATPWGYGFAKFDKDSNLIWRYDGRVHHDIDVDENGRIAILTHRLRDEKVPGLDHMKTPMVEDFLVLLSPEGEEIASHSIYDALAKPEWRHFLELASEKENGDYLHTNAVRYVPREYAEKHQGVEAGDIVITCRDTDCAFIVRPETGEVVWGDRLPVSTPHDTHALPNGNMMIFDNRGRKSGASPGSQVLEWNPVTSELVWSYQGEPYKLLNSAVRSTQQVLPNNNVLITESNTARLLEVSRDGGIVWEFISPYRSQVGSTRLGVAVICAGTRFAAEELSFLAAQDSPAE